MPLTAISFVVLVFLLNIQTKKTPLVQGLKKIDWLGSITIIAAAVMLLVGLQLGGTIYAWGSVQVVCLITFGIITFGIFTIIEWKIAKSPLIPLRFFSRCSRISILGVNVCQSMITTGCTYFLPLYFQLVLGTSPLRSAVYFLPTMLTLAFFFFCVGHVIKRTGAYLALIRVGACALILGCGLLINSQPYTSWPRIIIPQIIVSTGLGLTYQAPLIAFHAQIDQADVASGTSTFQFLKTISQTISVILGQVIFQSQVLKRSHSLVLLDIPSQLISQLTEGNVISSRVILHDLTESKQAAVRSVLATSLNDMWIFYTVVSFLSVVASLGMRRVKLKERA